MIMHHLRHLSICLHRHRMSSELWIVPRAPSVGIHPRPITAFAPRAVILSYGITRLALGVGGPPCESSAPPTSSAIPAHTKRLRGRADDAVLRRLLRCFEMQDDTDMRQRRGMPSGVHSRRATTLSDHVHAPSASSESGDPTVGGFSAACTASSSRSLALPLIFPSPRPPPLSAPAPPPAPARVFSADTQSNFLFSDVLDCFEMVSSSTLLDCRSVLDHLYAPLLCAPLRPSPVTHSGGWRVYCLALPYISLARSFRRLPLSLPPSLPPSVLHQRTMANLTSPSVLPPTSSESGIHLPTRMTCTGTKHRLADSAVVGSWRVAVRPTTCIERAFPSAIVLGHSSPSCS
ncbi:hypothetical protein B0H13DRAFT_2576896 [Mycena leptocephala]|nr:hypothetical protein B0H13DRAFT_2576896 [Mycena leptocephala]